ncbi:hypothetical protein CP49_41345 [Bradyrhizobium valentinum]|uniref:Uncharacterized protein n=1 Tax=Bradyrhizobium valentinum TaxID=1518501 RepID=A0A0R3L3V3_9BRAD|nr:hypothetical protein CP49_41345 [Bradyrhizobium valentinum]
MPITEIVEVAATCLESAVNFTHLPSVIRNERLPPVNGARAGAPQIDDDVVLAGPPAKKDAAILEWGQLSCVPAH